MSVRAIQRDPLPRRRWYLKGHGLTVLTASTVYTYSVILTLINRPIAYFDTSAMLITLILLDAVAELRVMMQRSQRSQFPVHGTRLYIIRPDTENKATDGRRTIPKQALTSSIYAELSCSDLYWSIGLDGGLIVWAQPAAVLISGTFCFT